MASLQDVNGITFQNNNLTRKISVDRLMSASAQPLFSAAAFRAGKEKRNLLRKSGK
jgi:hypothetical protein